MRLLVFGDSFVNGVGDPDHLGWVGRAVRGARSLTLYNLGVRRETSTDIAARWRREAEARLVDTEPCAVVFTFGANDCDADGGAPRVAPETVVANTLAILGGAALLAPTLMIGPPPTADVAVRERLRARNPLLAAAATQSGVLYLDLLAQEDRLDVWIKEAGEWDGAHPGAAGHQQLADVVAAWTRWRALTRP